MPWHQLGSGVKPPAPLGTAGSYKTGYPGASWTAPDGVLLSPARRAFAMRCIHHTVPRRRGSRTTSPSHNTDDQYSLRLHALHPLVILNRVVFSSPAVLRRAGRRFRRPRLPHCQRDLWTFPSPFESFVRYRTIIAYNPDGHDSETCVSTVPRSISTCP